MQHAHAQSSQVQLSPSWQQSQPDSQSHLQFVQQHASPMQQPAASLGVPEFDEKENAPAASTIAAAIIDFINISVIS